MFMKRLPGFVLIMVLLAGFVLAEPVGGRDLATGSGKIIIDAGLPGEPFLLPVFYHRPIGAGPNERVVIVIHGARRDAGYYRDVWIKPAKKYGFIVLAPEFSEEVFPGFWRFQMGNLFSATGRKKPFEHSTFALMERAFDSICSEYGIKARTYDLFGHSAGGQFVHRMVLLGLPHKIRRAVAANAGTYTVPDESIPLPFGVGGAGLTPRIVAEAFKIPMQIMAGGKDTDPYHRSLNRSSEAMAQGRHRLSRGQYFFNKSKLMADRLGLVLNWRFKIVPGVGHSAKEMSLAAAEYFNSN